MNRLLLLLAICAALPAARAEPPAKPPLIDPAPLPNGRVELITALAARTGTFDDALLPVRYDGLALAAFRLSTVTFPWERWGLGLDLSYERFRVRDRTFEEGDVDERLNAFHLFPSATGQWRLFSALPGLGVEAQIGYGIGAFPVVATSGGEPFRTSVLYSGPQLAGAVTFARGGLSGKLRASALPVAFTRTSKLETTSAHTLGFGAQVAWEVFTLGSFQTALLLDYEATSASAQLASGANYRTALGAHRFGVGLRAVLPGQRSVTRADTVLPPAPVASPVAAAPPTGPGTLRGLVRLTVSGDKSLPAPEVLVQVADGPSVQTALDGSFTLADVGPGPVSIVIEAKGYKRLEEVASIPAGGEARLELSLEPVAARALASMRGRVRSTRGRPVKGFLVVPEAQIRTATKADGSFLVRLPGGRYTVVFEAKGYVSQTKVIDVGSGDQALFYVDLSPKEP